MVGERIDFHIIRTARSATLRKYAWRKDTIFASMKLIPSKLDRVVLQHEPLILGKQ